MLTQFGMRQKKQRGIGVGYLLLIVVITAALGSAATRFGFDATSTLDGARSRLDAGVFAEQIGSIKSSLAMLEMATVSPWNNIGFNGVGGYLTLGTSASGFSSVADSSLDSSLRLLSPPAGSSGPLTWRLSTRSPAGFLYLYTESDVSPLVCQKFNLIARGQESVIANDTLANPSVSQTPTTGVIAYALGAEWFAAADVDLLGSDGCFATSSSRNRIIARIR